MWLHGASGCRAGRRPELASFRDLTQLGERALFDFAFVADTNATLGPDDVSFWFSPRWSFRNCSVEGCSAPPTRGAHCAKTSVLRDRKTSLPPGISGPRNDRY